MRTEINGYERFTLPSGAEYRRIHYYADPEKGPEWLEATRREMLGTPIEFRQQILMDETAIGGTPVYGNYIDQIHAHHLAVGESWPIYPHATYWGGFDGGLSLQPAFSLFQVTAIPFQIHMVLELISNGSESMKEFAPRVVQRLKEWHPGLWSAVNYFGDATIGTRAGTNGQTAREVAQEEAGIDIMPISNAWEPRRSAVAWMLERSIDDTNGIPGFKINARDCPVAHKGFQGAYQFKTSASGDVVGPGVILQVPLKNLYSHVHDSIQQVALPMREYIEARGSKVHRNEDY